MDRLMFMRKISRSIYNRPRDPIWEFMENFTRTTGKLQIPNPSLNLPFVHAPWKKQQKTGQVIIFHQPGFSWNKGISLTITTIWGPCSLVWGRELIWPEKTSFNLRSITLSVEGISANSSWFQWSHTWKQDGGPLQGGTIHHSLGFQLALRPRRFQVLMCFFFWGADHYRYMFSLLKPHVMIFSWFMMFLL